MIIKSYFGIKPCCDCGKVGCYTVIKKMEGGENEKLKMLRTGSRKNPERK